MIAWAQKQSMGLRLCFAFAYCAIFYALVFVFDGRAKDIITIALISVFPFFYGTAIQLVFDPQVRQPYMRLLGWGMVPVLLLCLVLVFLQFETLICVAILLPMFFIVMSIGVFLMAALLRRNVLPYDSTTFSVSLAFLPVLILPMLGQISFPTTQHTVTTQIEISAPRQAVWANTLTIDAIQDDERVWTASHNLLNTPVPIDARLSDNVRQLRWSHGIEFQEHLTHVAANTALEWNFVFNAPETLRSFDPHIDPQGSLVNLQRGAYTLTDLPNGNTQLTLSTYYTLTSPLNGYFAIWGDVFLQDFHYAVLSVIKSRSELEERTPQ